jgi:hypothetical protein
LPSAEGFELRELRLAGVPHGVEVLSAEICGCACSLVWDEDSDSTPAEVARWRKKGWSEAKIQRALGARTQARAHSHSGRAAFERWLADAARATPGLRVLVSEHGEAEPSRDEATEVAVDAFLRAPLRYKGVWVWLTSDPTPSEEA